jgi:hypothetical protein
MGKNTNYVALQEFTVSSKHWVVIPYNVTGHWTKVDHKQDNENRLPMPDGDWQQNNFSFKS